MHIYPWQNDPPSPPIEHRSLEHHYTKSVSYICHRHRIWVKEKTKRFRCIYSNQGFWHGCQQMHWWTTVFPVYMCSSLSTRRSKQMIMTSWNDVTRISCAILGGNYKRKAHSNLRLSSRSSDTECLGLLTSHRPSTLAISVPLIEQSITRDELCVSFIHMHVPRPFWGTFSQYDFSYLMLAG